MTVNAKLFIVLIFTSLIYSATQAQDPTRYQDEVDRLAAKEFSIDPSKQTVVFTGSSSIRMWKDVQERYPDVNAVNTGFGGSQFSDLIHYREELIFRHKPDKVFIYEGDNDIADGKSPSEVIAGAAFLLAQVRQELPEARVYFISPKPSLSHWHLRAEYEQANAKLKAFCDFDESITFVDVWNPMLNDEGKPKTDIFLDDNLHMNSKGYKIWTAEIAPYVSPD